MTPSFGGKGVLATIQSWQSLQGKSSRQWPLDAMLKYPVPDLGALPLYLSPFPISPASLKGKSPPHFPSHPPSPHPTPISKRHLWTSQLHKTQQARATEHPKLKADLAVGGLRAHGIDVEVHRLVLPAEIQPQQLRDEQLCHGWYQLQARS